MSMLAERKRKTRYVLNPMKKPLWTADSGGIKFGRDLMEKMGWSAGKGLGASEQGIQEPLRVSYKNDNKGIGFKGNEENWIEYQDEFNSLLNQLASVTDQNIEVKECEKSEIVSLEEKSKLSKSRVHYQKFTRGKDLSKYSENDLSCILGISRTKKANNEEVQLCNNTHETSFGVTTINSGSIKEYFKKKWILNNLKCDENSNAGKSQNDFGDEHQFVEEGCAVAENKSKKGHRESIKECEKGENESDENVQKEKKHKKKRKDKSEKEYKMDIFEADIKLEKDEEPLKATIFPDVSEGCSEDVQFKTKKKKKRGLEELQEVELKGQTEVVGGKIKNKKRKKEKESEEKFRNMHEEELSGNMKEPETINDTPEEKSKRKKKRRKEEKIEESLETSNNYEMQVNGGSTVEDLKNEDRVTAEKKTSKKKKKKKEAEFQEEHEYNCEEKLKEPKNQTENSVEDQPDKKRKRKKEKGVEDLQKGVQNFVQYSAKNGSIKEENKRKEKLLGENTEQQIESFEGEFSNQIVEEKAVKKKKKKKKDLEGSDEEKEKQSNEELSKMEVTIEDAVNKAKKKKNEENMLPFQPEEIRKNVKKSKKEKKDETEKRDDQQKADTLESPNKVSKRKKDKTKSCSEAVDTCLTLKEPRNDIGSYKEEEGNNNGGDCKGEPGETLIHSHKTVLFQMKKPFLDNSTREYSPEKGLFNCDAEIEMFKGANLAKITGYGCKKKAINLGGI